jgi:hypothetical protein
MIEGYTTRFTSTNQNKITTSNLKLRRNMKRKVIKLLTTLCRSSARISPLLHNSRTTTTTWARQHHRAGRLPGNHNTKLACPSMHPHHGITYAVIIMRFPIMIGFSRNVRARHWAGRFKPPFALPFCLEQHPCSHTSAGTGRKLGRIQRDADDPTIFF